MKTNFNLVETLHKPIINYNSTKQHSFGINHSEDDTKIKEEIKDLLKEKRISYDKVWGLVM